jgi:hypothetical protein
MRARDFVKRNIAYHSKLNPVAWIRGQLRPEVREHLLKIAGVFEHYLEIPNFEVQDIVLTGSLANYNYTPYSDFDLHVVTDYRDLECDDVAEALYRAKKEIWNDQHDITIRGHEVELYIEDLAQPPVSAGMYSLLKDQWIREPSYDPPKINDSAVNAKVADLIKQITVAIETADDPEDLKRIKDKIRKMRRSGLDTEGEFGVENLAFKILRNQGYLDRLNQAYLDQQDQELSLSETKHTETLTRGSFTIQLNKDHLIDRTQERQVNPANVDAILNQVPKLKAKILKYVIGEEFWIHNPRLNTSVGMRMISPERRILRANTAIIGLTTGDRNPTIVIH